MTIVPQIEEALADLSNAEKAIAMKRFFKTGPGQYGEGDQFLGVTVPYQRKVARYFYKTTTLNDLQILLQSPLHEHRLTALFILVLQFEKEKNEISHKRIIDFYLHHIHYVNNWDLVDSSAPYLLGAYLHNKPKKLLYNFATSGQLWKQRISIISTFYFIKQKEYNDTLAIAEMLLQHPHDLIHKATGWMLREVGNRDRNVEIDFLARHYHAMPRTMLRYAIEKLDELTRQQFLKGTI